MLTGIIIYGPYVILCEKYGLVTPYVEDDIDDEDEDEDEKD